MMVLLTQGIITGVQALCKRSVRSGIFYWTQFWIFFFSIVFSIVVFLGKIIWLGDNVAHCFSFFLTVLFTQSALFILIEKIISTLVLIVPSLVFLFQGERSTLGAMSLGSLSQSGSLSPRRNSRSSLGGSRSSLHRSNESLPTASRSATADAIFME